MTMSGTPIEAIQPVAPYSVELRGLRGADLIAATSPAYRNLPIEETPRPPSSFLSQPS
jgi:hypothetical protein